MRHPKIGETVVTPLAAWAASLLAAYDHMKTPQTQDREKLRAFAPHIVHPA